MTAYLGSAPISRAKVAPKRTMAVMAMAALRLLCSMLAVASAQHVLGLSRSQKAAGGWRRSSWRAAGSGAASAQSLSAAGDTELSAELRAGGLDTERVRNRMDVEYTARFELGTPARAVRLVFDTGSSDLWVAASAFDAAASSSWDSSGLQEQGVQYGLGAVRGVVGFETGCLPTSPRPLCVEMQPMILATEIASLNLTSMDGILGLGFIGLTTTPLTFLRNLNQSFQDLSFAFSLESGEGSFVVFGEKEDVMRLGYSANPDAAVARADVVAQQV